VTVFSDIRFGSRSAALAAYILGTLGKFEVIVRGLDAEAEQRLIASTMLRFGKRMSRLFGIEVVTSGVPAEGYVAGRGASGAGRVFVSNHRSGLDILVTMAHLEGKHVSRADLAKWPVIGMIARRAGILFVDRESKRSAAAVVHQMIEVVSAGRGIIIFPEGTTFAGDEVRPFKPGAFAVARRTGCEIVPVGLAYAGKGASFDEESFLEHMRRVAGAPTTRVGLAVGEPLTFERGADPAEVSNRVHERVSELVKEARALVDGG
jgi:1-acyl-sn-glycerol-3-phosphate acyltransferase